MKPRRRKEPSGSLPSEVLTWTSYWTCPRKFFLVIILLIWNCPFWKDVLTWVILCVIFSIFCYSKIVIFGKTCQCNVIFSWSEITMSGKTCPLECFIFLFCWFQIEISEKTKVFHWNIFVDKITMSFVDFPLSFLKSQKFFITIFLLI